MTHNYYYKHESQDNLVYIHCQWLNDVAIEAESDLIICQMSVSDTKAFWSSNVAMKDIVRHRSLHIDVDLWKQLIQAAFTGKSEFRGEPLNRMLKLSNDKCIVSWISRLEGSIDLQIAELTLQRVATEETSDRWKALLNALFEDDRQLRDSREAMIARIKGLEESCEQLKQVAEKVVRDKLDAELLLMDKFKLVLNAKKRKIKDLTTTLQNADLLQPAASAITGTPQSQALGTASSSISKSPNPIASTHKGKRKRTKVRERQEEIPASPGEGTSEGKQKLRRRSLSRTPSLEELMAQTPMKINPNSDHQVDNSPPATSSSIDNEGHSLDTSMEPKGQLTSESNDSLAQETAAQSSVVKDEHTNDISSLLDDDDLFFRPRMVKTVRKQKRA